MLALLAAFDFDTLTTEQGPTGWAHIHYTVARGTTTVSNGVGLRFTQPLGQNPFQGFSANYLAGSIPSGLAPVIRSGFFANNGGMAFALNGLESNKAYELWLLAGSSNVTTNQTVRIGADNGVSSFVQPISGLNLSVNDRIGNSATTLESFPSILIPAPTAVDVNNDGEIDGLGVTVTVTGSGPVFLAGVAIREYTPSPNYTLPAGGGAFTLKIEDGRRVLKSDANNSLLAIFPSTGAISITGTDAGNEQLTVNLASGNPVLEGVTFQGGTGGNDTLQISGGNQGAVTYTYANAHDGSINLANFGPVNFTGLEPIINTGSATDITFHLPTGASNIATLGDDGVSGNGRSHLSGATFPPTDFSNPSGSISIDRGTAADTMSVVALPDLTARMTIGSAASAFSAATFAGSMTLAAGKDLQVASSSLSALAGSSLAVSSGGAIRLIADSIVIDAAAAISASSGEVSLSPLTAGQSIDLGGGDGPGTLGLTDPELDRISAGTLQIGGVNAGPITFLADINRTISTNMRITAGANANIQLGTFSLNAAGGDITLATSDSGGITTGDNAGSDLLGDDVALSSGTGGIGDSINSIRLSANTISALTSGSYSLTEADSVTIVAPGLRGTGANWLPAGTFVLGGGNVIEDDDLITLGGHLRLNGFNETLAAFAMQPEATIVNGSATHATLTFADTFASYAMNGKLGGTTADDNNFSINKTGSGSVNLVGDNSFTGTYLATGGIITIGHPNALGSTAGSTSISGNAVLNLNGVTLAAEPLNLQSTGASGRPGLDNSTATPVVYSGPITLSGDASIGGAGVLTVTGMIDDGAAMFGLTKLGAGTVTLTNDNTYDGATLVSSGKLVIDGSVTSDVSVAANGELNGNGTIQGNVSGNGIFSPGNSPGRMTILGDFTPSGTVSFEVNSNWTLAGVDFDQYAVSGAADLSQATLAFTNNADTAPPPLQTTLKLIDHAGLQAAQPGVNPADGAVFAIGSRTFKLLYNGGDGNDLVLTTDINLPPTGIALSNASVVENQPSGTSVGTFSTTDPEGGLFTYMLVPGDGDNDNARFTIDASGNLKTAAILDFEAGSQLSIRVRTTDAGGLSFETALLIDLVNQNEPPTAIQLTNASIAENQPPGSLVGALTASDPEGAGQFTFQFVAGAGDNDNASFALVNGTLITAAEFDFEWKSSYSVRIQVTDQGGLTFQKAFSLNVTNVNEAPFGLSLSSATLAENQPGGTLVGTFGADDAEFDPLTYTFVGGAGSADNARFTIDGSGNLRSAGPLDYETQSAYSIRVRTADPGGLGAESIFLVTLLDLDERAPTVTIEQSPGQADPAETSPLSFTVTFSEPVFGFDPSDLDFSGSTVPGSLSASILGAGPVYTVLVSGMAGGGTVYAAVRAGAAQDAAGNLSTGSSSNDNSVNYQAAEVFTNTSGVTNLIVMLDASATKAQIRAYHAAGPILFEAPLASLLSLQIIGSNAAETVTIDDIHGLPRFLGALPSASGTGDNPATSDNDATAGPELFILGGGGTDVLRFNLNRAATSQIYALGAGGGPGNQEGEIQTTDADAGLNLYFRDIDELQSIGRGGSDFTVIGDDSANRFTLAADGPNTRMVPVGYVPWSFTGNNFSSVALLGQGGRDSFDLYSLGSDQRNSLPLIFDGGGDDDLLKVRSNSYNSGAITLRGQTGNDLFLLSDSNADTYPPLGPAGNVDGIGARVIVDGGPPTDTDVLAIDDATSPFGGVVAITLTSLDGLTSAPGGDVTYQNIDLLDVAASNGANSLQYDLLNGLRPDLDTVRLRGSGGDDTFLPAATNFATASNPLTQIQFLELIGGQGNDTFGSPAANQRLRPDLGLLGGTQITLVGDEAVGPASPLTGNAPSGDKLYLDVSLAASTVWVDTAAGLVASASHRPLNFNGLKQLTLWDGGSYFAATPLSTQMGDLYVRLSDDSENVQIAGSGMIGDDRVDLTVQGAAYGPFFPKRRVQVFGRGGDDTLTVSATAPTTLLYELRGEAGNDSLTGGAGNDLLVGGRGNDTLQAMGGDNLLWGDDELLDVTTGIPLQGMLAPSAVFVNPPAASRDLGLATDGNDTLSAGNGNDTYFGGGGNDRIFDTGGSNYLNGGSGDDQLTGGKNDDLLRGGPGSDQLNGDDGQDILAGGDGIDFLQGGPGRDLLLGGRSNDTLTDNDSDSDLLLSDQTPYDVDVGAYANGAGGNPRFPGQLELRSANDLALLALLQQWSSAASPAQNRLMIRSGVALQSTTPIGTPAWNMPTPFGAVPLSAQLLPGAGGNVTADGQQDRLLGNLAAMDWVLAQLSGPTRPAFGSSLLKDQLVGLTAASGDLLDSTV